MELLTLFGIAVALSMDAFSVSVCKGLSTARFSWTTALVCGLWFGVFQALMPLIGYFLGSSFASFIEKIDHWVAFGLLTLIGLNMIREAIFNKDETTDSSIGFFTMFLLAIATSIDAFAIGISFSLLHVEIWSSILIIGLTTFIFSVVGVAIGTYFGSRYSKPATIVGGCVLILLGLKILFE